MAMSPCTLLAKLDELKKWQELQHERLLKQHNSRLEETDRGCKINVSDFDTIQGLSAFNSLNLETGITHQPSEQKNGADGNDVIQEAAVVKPKQPFLKRGTGLGKFGMKAGDQRRPFNKMRPPETAVHKRLAALRKAAKKQVHFKHSEKPNVEVINDDIGNHCRSISPVIEILHTNDQDPIDPQYSITPLKMPEVGIQPKTNWFPVVEDVIIQESEDTVSDIHQISPIKLQNSNSSGVISEDLLKCLKKLASEKFGDCNINNDRDKDILEEIDEIASGRIKPIDDRPPNVVKYSSTDATHANKQFLDYLKSLINGSSSIIESLTCDSSANTTQSGDTTGYEKALERELHVFEQLEQKVMNSSFCSTNSSIIDLLSSTPHKLFRREPVKIPTIETIHEKKAVHFNEIMNTSGAKRELDFQPLSDESSVNSDDFENHTLQENWNNGESTEASSSSSMQSVAERPVIVRQNACVMTDDLEFSSNKPPGEDEALSNRLHELDIEITNFRRENSKLQRAKSDVEKERREMQKSKKKLERELQDERIKMEFDTEEERKKLAKERMVFERYAKDLQNKPSKKEREEICDLKTELANTKETLKLKETRNGTTQARLRNQIKTLEKENSNLKEEVEKLQKQNAKLTATQKVVRKPSDTKVLHEINRNLTKLAQDAKVSKQVGHVTKSVEPLNDSLIALSEKSGSNKSRKCRRKDDDLYETEYRRSYSEKREENLTVPESTDNRTLHDSDDESISGVAPNQFIRNYKETLPRTKLQAELTKRSKGSNDSQDDYQSSKITEVEHDRNTTNFDTTLFRNLSGLSIEHTYDKVFGGKQARSRNNSLNDTQGTTGGKVETTLEDGSKEIKYPNGNLKYVSPDGNLIRLKYYNGDIKETKLLEGAIKYFYAETEMWQTTLPNGDEVLEFSDGQIEKRFSNGSSEVTFTNGVVKQTDTDGTEKMMYPDGSIVTVTGDDKVLLLPNGQKEIHTTEHKRREYPDGTVKILYPDGLQETRYSNGRIRMKDKDGHLLMDTHGDDM